MAQAAFEFSPLATLGDRPADSRTGLVRGRPGNSDTRDTRQITEQPAGFDRTGFEIGWDHAHHRITPPLRHLHGNNPVRQGWDAGRAAFGARTLRPTAAVRQWLALRLEAWLHGQVFEGVQVNPHFLARIDATHCPVSRVPLTLSAALPTDATVSRLNHAAAYAAGNLAVLSGRVATAQAGSDWATAQAHADSLLAAATSVSGAGRSAAQATTEINGLNATEWARLAVLASFATPLPHAQAALLPLRVLPPNRTRVINPVQALQVMLTLQFTQAGFARRLLGLAVLMPSSETRQAFQIFMHTLLARRLAVGQALDRPAMRLAMEDSWADALVNRRWQRLATRLTPAECEQLLQRASQRGLVVGGGQWVSTLAATEGWALEAGAVRQAGLASVLVSRPDMARSLGSQNLAS